MATPSPAERATPTRFCWPASSLGGSQRQRGLAFAEQPSRVVEAPRVAYDRYAADVGTLAGLNGEAVQLSNLGGGPWPRAEPSPW
jgi:hypothetical protein